MFSLTSVVLALALVAPAQGPAEKAAETGKPAVVVAVIRDGGGSAASAQPLVERLVARWAAVQGWEHAVGKYFVNRPAARAEVVALDPGLLILSLRGLSELSTDVALEVIGEVDMAHAGGKQYFLVSATKGGAEVCANQKVSSDHFEAREFLQRAVFSGGVSLAGFVEVPAKRPVQTIKMLTRGEVQCALIDDAQLATLRTQDVDHVFSVVWQSDEFPGMVVARPKAGGAAAKSIAKNLEKICAGEGSQVCSDAGITKITAKLTTSTVRAVTAILGVGVEKVKSPSSKK